MKNKSADGLRGIAAFNVVVTHFVAAFLPMMLHKNYPGSFPENSNPSTAFDILTSPFVSILYNGHLAVLIFFVLSGYVLTLPYYNNQTNSKPILEKRLWGRYLRLNIPIAIAIGLSFLIYSLGLYSNVQAAEISGSVAWFKTFLPQGITTLGAAKEAIYEAIFYGKGTLIPPLWTLKIEFIGSIYILLFYISKPKESTFVPLLMVFCLIYAIHQQDSMYYFAIFFGSFLNSITKSAKFAKYRAVLFVAGLYFGAFQFNSIFYNYLPDLKISGVEIWERKTFYSAIGGGLITAAVVQGFASAIFESRAMQFLGRISFSIYLMHFIVLCSLASFVYIHLPQSKLFWALNFLLYVFVCFVVSVVFEKFVDKKSIDISHKFSSKMFS